MQHQRLDARSSNYASMPAGVYGHITHTHTFTPPEEYQAFKWRAYLPQHEVNSTASISPQSTGTFNTFNSPAYSLITFTFL